jgi:hypothetical protein
MGTNHKEYMRTYMKEYRKKYKEKNTEKVKEWSNKANKKWRENNKEKLKEIVTNWRENHHNNIWKVYILPNADYYVGYTKAIKPRMYRHKQDGRDYSDYMILHECSTKQEAMEYEKIYHKLGFPGGKKK